MDILELNDKIKNYRTITSTLRQKLITKLSLLSNIELKELRGQISHNEANLIALEKKLPKIKYGGKERRLK